MYGEYHFALGFESDVVCKVKEGSLYGLYEEEVDVFIAVLLDAFEVVVDAFFFCFENKGVVLRVV